MEVFDVDYVYDIEKRAMAQATLVGKKVFFADSIAALKAKVSSCRKLTETLVLEGVVTTDDTDLTFVLENKLHYRYIYYDPDYKAKAAFKLGGKIQFKSGDKWFDWTFSTEPDWALHEEWRDVTSNKELKLGDTVAISAKVKGIITAIDMDRGTCYFVAGMWYYANELTLVGE